MRKHQTKPLRAHQQDVLILPGPPVGDVRKCQNGARTQGFATPRNPGAPLRAARRSGRGGPATGGSGGMSKATIVFDRKPEANQHVRRLHGVADINRIERSNGSSEKN
jgi:hypothetical protein